MSHRIFNLYLYCKGLYGFLNYGNNTEIMVRVIIDPSQPGFDVKPGGKKKRTSGVLDPRPSKMPPA